MKSSALVIGLGEVGKPLMEFLGRAYVVHGKDLEPLKLGEVDVLHICYGYADKDFVDCTVDYIKEYRPQLTIIHSTVVPGTTRRISVRSQNPVVYSPIRGKHTRMYQDLSRYRKFIAGLDQQATEQAAAHLEAVGFTTQPMNSCEGLELAKLLETSYFGLLIAWAQETERFCRIVGAEYDEVMQFSEEIDFFPPVVFQPGYIGGHCVIPNTYLLEQIKHSPLIEALRTSNELKAQALKVQGHSLQDRVSPKPKRRKLPRYQAGPNGQAKGLGLQSSLNEEKE
jgi:UDP-N-acetyl-D-mannosaminuronate dehydrogenase